MGQGNAFRKSSRELPWELRRRGLKDSLRHDQRVKEAIRKNLRELIAEEAIITSDGTRRVRIPLRYLDQYRFKYGQPPQGVGQGQGEPGDVIGQRNGNGNDPGCRTAVSCYSSTRHKQGHYDLGRQLLGGHSGRRIQSAALHRQRL